ncbi:hypothetical protein AAC387_Pa03g2977 [Persea americana]|eukprot:TRINITY_DN45528_c0_g1_i2.p1 TRINITY_DN45528_c0_g1~~TRINITY_DN45528_c0_g1_i2.p1  ORF type:complete len:166 (-),score=48.21 TRINITY_DN45528_c0_g1_i2:462-959(-)
MEPSQLIGAIEECNSSESGWTKYITSPMHDEDHDGSSTDDGDDSCGDDDAGDSDDDNDSMASDASSGPSHRHHSYMNIDGGNGMRHMEHKKEDDDDDDDDEVGHHSYERKFTEKVRTREMKKEKTQREKEKFLICSRTKEPTENLIRRKWQGTKEYVCIKRMYRN